MVSSSVLSTRHLLVLSACHRRKWQAASPWKYSRRRFGLFSLCHKWRHCPNCSFLVPSVDLAALKSACRCDFSPIQISKCLDISQLSVVHSLLSLFLLSTFRHSARSSLNHVKPPSCIIEETPPHKPRQWGKGAAACEEEIEANETTYYKTSTTASAIVEETEANDGCRESLDS